jgi:two-component system, OmpR family, sensor histidine kinase SenX3
VIVTGRRKTIAFFIALGAGLVSITLLLYVGWVLLNWRTGILLFLGVVLLAIIIGGVVLNTIFLVREIRRNEQHDAFINAVTHELKTPVASIRLYLETLQSRPVEEAKRQEFYRIMLAENDRLHSTIEQVLRTGRLGASRKLNLSSFDLNTIITECLDRLRTIHPESTVHLAFTSAGPIAMRADADDIRAAVSNLLDNAVKYSAKPAQVEVETRVVDGKYVQLRVRDEGPGIAKGELKQIFKRFYRIPGALAGKVKGTGLGLFIVRSVAQRHGGKAWAESDGLGSGSTFILQLPLKT